MKPDFISVAALVLEVMLLTALGRFAWRNRERKFLFWGWLVVLAMLATIDVAFFAGLLSK